MMSNPNELLEHWNWLEMRIQETLETLEQLRQEQKHTESKMPRLYFVEGFGDKHGLAERIHFVGSHEECKAWVGANPAFTLDERGEQIYIQPTPKIGTFQLTGLIRHVTPVGKRWFEISSLVDAKKGDEETKS
jgi:hypothetical protein